MRQPRFTTIQWNTGPRFILLELRSLVLQLRHGHKEQVVGFKDPGYLIDQSTDLSLPRMMNNLDRQDGIKKTKNGKLY
jgi:hypothetical protein